MSLVQFNNVSKIYGKDIMAVDNVSFQVEEGEFVFLIGPSGSGKTTVIKMLIRDERPSIGKIYFKDKDITKINRKHVYRLRREVGVIFQDYKLVPERTVFENVAFAMEAAGKGDKEINETVPYVLDIVGLSHRMESFPKQLSGGEQQRVAIARAIANSPKILIADEPTGNLDPASAWDIVQILTKINNWGTTIIMSTHGTDIVNSLNKRVIQMEGGRIVRDDNKGQYELTNKYEKNILEKEDDGEAKEEISKVQKKKSTFKLNISSDKQEVKEELPYEIAKKKEKKNFFTRFKKEKVNEPEKESIIQEIEETKPEKVKPEKEEKILNAANNPFSKTEEQEVLQKKPLHITLDKELDLDEEQENDDHKKSKIENLKSEEANEAKSKPKNKDESEALENGELFLKKFSKMKVEELDLPQKIVDELKESGFKNVKDILEEGPEGIEEKIDLDKKDLVKVAKAIDKVAEER